MSISPVPMLTDSEYQALYRYLRRDYGYHRIPYRTIDGCWRVGIGWRLDEDGIPPDVMPALCQCHFVFPDVVIEHLFAHQLEDAVDYVGELTPVADLPSAIKIALVQLAFGMRHDLRRQQGILEAMVAKDWLQLREKIREMAGNSDNPALSTRLVRYIDAYMRVSGMTMMGRQHEPE